MKDRHPHERQRRLPHRQPDHASNCHNGQSPGFPMAQAVTECGGLFQTGRLLGCVPQLLTPRRILLARCTHGECRALGE